MAIKDIAGGGPTRNTRPGPKCRVCVALETIPKSEAEALVAMLSDPRWHYTDIATLIANDKDTPLDIDEKSYARHAQGKCSARTVLR